MTTRVSIKNLRVTLFIKFWFGKPPRKPPDPKSLFAFLPSFILMIGIILGTCFHVEKTRYYQENPTCNSTLFYIYILGTTKYWNQRIQALNHLLVVIEKENLYIMDPKKDWESTEILYIFSLTDKEMNFYISNTKLGSDKF